MSTTGLFQVRSTFYLPMFSVVAFCYENHFRLYGHIVSTYESASTRRFLLGRVDCIRSATTEALEWAKAMNQDQAIGATGGNELEPGEKRRLQYTVHSVSNDVKSRNLDVKFNRL